MIIRLKIPALALLLVALVFSVAATAQTAALHGQVQDPSGAVVPGAAIWLTGGAKPMQARSGADGQYAFHALAAGTYSITVTAKGFARLAIPTVTVKAGEAKELNLPLAIAVEQQDVEVNGQNQGVSIESDHNANAMVIKGSDIDALSDDPTELQNELQALAGPAAGPNGGQIYIDGFEGGQIPPKSAILEIRVNQNPFSAEYDRIGYGRIEIITKPGTEKFQGSIYSFGNDSALNTGNPLVTQQPSYDVYSYSGNVSGPITKTSSFFFNAFTISRQNSNIVDALNPATLNSNINTAFPAPSNFFVINPRIDFQLTKNNFMTIRDSFYRSSSQGNGVGTLNLPAQASSTLSHNNELEIGDTWVVNPHLLLEPHFLWRHLGSDTTPTFPTPTVTVQGAFTNGGASSSITRDHEDILMLQTYGTATMGAHTLRFGGRARSYRDVNFATSGANGNYFFSSIAGYQSGTPSLYSQTVINNPTANALLFDGSLFMQDDWRVNQRLLLGLGMRYEGQNYIHDHADWAPRLALAWTPAHPGKTPPKTVIRAGYGWFFNRFILPSAFNGGTPYVIQAIHDNLINQRSYTVANPTFFDPNAAQPASVLTSTGTSVPTYHSIDRHFHAALDMQAGIGVDHQFGKHVTSNVTYLYTQGVHQYFTNNVTAPSFDETDYTITGPMPATYDYEFQSGGVYRQNQLIFSAGLQLKKLTLSGNYTLNEAKSDTQGVTSFPSVAQDPGFDYGRASFGIRHRLFLLESYSAPHGIVFASLLEAQSGTPYNLTIGNDLTGSNQFNARPAYGTCGDTGVVATQYGCLDTDPAGKIEPVVPYGAGLGPANVVYHVRISKVVGIGPRLKTEGKGLTFTPGQGSVGGRGIGSGGPSIRLDAAAPRRFNLTLAAGINNVFNIVNWGTPNGVLLSPLFNKTQSLAGGNYSGGGVPGNRSVYLQSSLSF